LFENTGALPRVQLYNSWITKSNAADALGVLTNETFDAHQQVVVTGDLPPAPTSARTNIAGTVDFASYAPRHIVLKSQSAEPSVLLLNDHFDARWRVSVDGKQAPLLRCNFIMRGVYLEPGNHTVRFDYDPPLRALYVSLGAIAVALCLTGFVVWGERRTPAPAPTAQTRLPARPASEEPVPEPVSAGAVGSSPAKPAGGGKRTKQRKK
jgi:hypothetical protein